VCFCWLSKAILLQFISQMHPSVVGIIHNVIQINLQLLNTLVSLLPEGDGVEFIYEGSIDLSP